MSRFVRASIAFTIALLAGARCATAAPAGADLAGTILRDGTALANATVRATGDGLTASARTDARGRFDFASLPLGTYDVEVRVGDAAASARVELGRDGVTVALNLAPIRDLRTIGIVRTTRANAVRGSGADVAWDAKFLDRAPSGGSFSEALIQLPGAVRGANGVVHIDGDHGVLDYVVDGVPLPQDLNRAIGGEIDPNDVSHVDVLEGAFPAQYGLRFGSVVDVATRSGSGPAGFSGYARAGSYADLDASLAYHTPLANGGGLTVGIRDERGTRGLDPPNFDSPHNDFGDANEFVRIVRPRGPQDFTSLTVLHSYRTYQIPNDVANGQPATSDDNETQEDTFLNLQFHQHLGAGGSLTFGPAIKISRIRDFGDPRDDYAFGEASHLASGGASDDCANALASGSYGPGTCAFSLAGDKTATDYRFGADYVGRAGAHELRAGFAFDEADVGKRYAISLQPGNFLAPLVTPRTPGSATTVVDANPNSGNTYESYVSDLWKMGDRYTLESGLRYDYFDIASTGFDQGFGAFGPRFKFTRSFGPRANVYAYVGRLFEPFSFENVDPHVAQLLNLPLQPKLARFDLKPERDTLLELGGHAPLGAGTLGFRVWQKNANDLIDDTQVGVTLLHQDINYVLGRISQESVAYEIPLARGGRAYGSVAHTVSLNKGCETQLLAPCFGSPTDFTPADHDQTWSANGGFVANDARDGWLSFEGEYGSGLSSASCAATVVGSCKRTPHVVFSGERGIAIAPGLALTLRIRNLWNDRYFVTLDNAQGDHYAEPRTFAAGLQFGR